VKSGLTSLASNSASWSRQKCFSRRWSGRSVDLVGTQEAWRVAREAKGWDRSQP
jgi:hypothetical protein